MMYEARVLLGDRVQIHHVCDRHRRRLRDVFGGNVVSIKYASDVECEPCQNQH